jgi:hypothetical protein
VAVTGLARVLDNLAKLKPANPCETGKSLFWGRNIAQVGSTWQIQLPEQEQIFAAFKIGNGHETAIVLL